MLILKGASEEVDAVRFTPDGRGLIVPRWRGDQLWPDWASGGKPVAVARLADGVECVSPNGRYALGTSGWHLTLYDLVAGTATALDPELPASYVVMATFTPDGRRIITSHRSSPPPHLRCTQIEAPHPVVWSVPTADPVARLVFLDAGRFVGLEFATRHSGFVAVPYDAATGETVGEVRVDVPYRLECLITSPDGRCVVGHYATRLLVYQSADLAAAPIIVRNTSRKAFSGLAFHPSGRWLAATSNDASVKLYDVATWEVTRTFDWKIGRLRSVAFTPDGTVAAAGGDKGRVVVWDFDE